MTDQAKAEARAKKWRQDLICQHPIEVPGHSGDSNERFDKRLADLILSVQEDAEKEQDERIIGKLRDFVNRLSIMPENQIRKEAIAERNAKVTREIKMMAAGHGIDGSVRVTCEELLRRLGLT